MTKKHRIILIAFACLLLAGIGYLQSSRVWGTRLHRQSDLVWLDKASKTSYAFSNKDSQKAFLQLYKAGETESQTLRQVELSRGTVSVIDETSYPTTVFGGENGAELSVTRSSGGSTVTTVIEVPAGLHAQLTIRTEYNQTIYQLEELTNGKWTTLGTVTVQVEGDSYQEPLFYTEEEWEEKFAN
jgi:hypothetical protein